MAQFRRFLLFSASGALIASCNNMSIRYMSERTALDGLEGMYSYISQKKYGSYVSSLLEEIQDK